MKKKVVPNKLWIKVVILLCLTVFAFFVWSINFRKTIACDTERLCVAFLDVGQGDATFIQSPSGMQMLVDGGRDRVVLRKLSVVMRSRDMSIDYVVATHTDADHITGLVDVIKRYAVSTIVATKNMSDTSISRQFQEASAQSTAKKVVPFVGDTYDLGSGVLVTVLYPDEDVIGIDPNDASIVLHVRYGAADFILTGDASLTSEYAIGNRLGTLVQAEVLKAGHHGSRTSSGIYFLERVQPDIAIISAGRDNSYGHPNNDVLQNFDNIGAMVVNTADNGTIVIETDGEEIEVRNLR